MKKGDRIKRMQDMECIRIKPKIKQDQGIVDRGEGGGRKYEGRREGWKKTH